jgi:3-hydroxymyristoyl/3-hydroxydecanoyl-(acyl carrier protein) dehydratase
MTTDFTMTPLVQEADRYEWRVLVPHDLLYLRGHFEGDPIVPAIAILERLVRYHARECWPELDRLIQIRQLKFRRPVRPGDSLRLHLERRSESRVAFRLDRGAERCSTGILQYEAPE